MKAQESMKLTGPKRAPCPTYTIRSCFESRIKKKNRFSDSRIRKAVNPWEEKTIPEKELFTL